MKKLSEIASILRSKNAGPLFITFDIMFSDKSSFEKVMQSGAINKKVIAQEYEVNPKEVEIIPYDIVNSIKVTIPRKCISGSLNDMDIYGCQQQVPIANIIIP
jgi:hypothetical protein